MPIARPILLPEFALGGAAVESNREPEDMERALISLWLSVASYGLSSPTPASAAKTTTEPTLHPTVRVVTNRGEFTMELDAEKAPGTVLNFVQYVEDRFYDGTIFHRVIKDFVIQAGGYVPPMTRKTDGLRPPIRNEAINGLSNKAHSVAMARSADPHSASAQFYVNVADNSDLLDYKPSYGKEGYTVFGKVVDGFETIEKIRTADVSLHPAFRTREGAVTPVEPVVIESTTVLKPLDKEKARQLADELAKRSIEEEKKVQQLAATQLPDRIAKLEAEHNAKFTAGESGLKFIDVKVGQGASPTHADEVEVNYRGTLVDGTEFDSSEKSGGGASVGRGSAFFKIERVMRGWQLGLESMHEGGKRILVIPPDLAYGKDGIPGRVPPDSTLFFEVELLQVKPGTP